ncbi:polysaccharide deacetylase family protein [Anabaena cylindrica FACHB-243]|uniref:Polysaccharide deacetylase n=1 Tax=Anabaena cylindrica (strain ATCC 27899 / PCC 7122) TaxID=272123 RepID=K9ZNF8_ANACC|nr:MULTISPECIES: polysaccharide deacetylase family protein [Anabaena]AFZ60324.1 polysaccharide deacetylase [Anabaena cylindrica PCC 7122]MBD2418949.1 polysaccharide deacetylase family protein [Anabaena cylindrica FACHB-243]MBY5308857.1 polysaccharide deacetylase family protein [Anabaena sp. CCAP 1446/1C]MCM2404540.1 polysaccharide deacetylase family protein [Anabaena sp. CCAP 1446/1C]BAY02605.1 polysaccharide deacetylase [Anabaena cylindrica PCC 7122]
MQFASLFPLIHRILQPSFPNCLWHGNIHSQAIPTERFAIALTFDDGPHPLYTPQVLAVLDHYKITASFFWLGVCVNRSPHIAKAVTDAGHWIGLHGYEHHSFPLLSSTDLKQSLEKTQAAIYNACNLQPSLVRDVRPPNGFFTPQTLKLFQQWNYRPVMWSVVPEDWVRPGVSVVVQRILEQVKGGSIIVLHDGVCGGQDVAQTIQILIPQLLQLGYEFVTVDSLWQH